MKDNGRAAEAEPALVNQAATRLGPSGFDPARERMSPGFAVFNGHVNDADKRARAFMAAHCPADLALVEQAERDGGGIMHIFSLCGLTWGPNALRRYIELVTEFVNEDRRDSAGSGEAGERPKSGSTVGDSAGLQASPENPLPHPERGRE